MKKSLLLSLAASTVLFAGGDIAPVEPVAESPAAGCDDFYGTAAAGVQYVVVKNGAGTKIREDLRYGVAAVLGVNKEIFSGVTLTAEVQGGYFEYKNRLTGVTVDHIETGALTQLNLGYSWCNTAIKVGRFAVPEDLSPLAFTDEDHLGQKDVTFDGVLVANTDLPDTTLWVSYLRHVVGHVTAYPTARGGSSATADVNILAGGFRNTSFADTVITAAAYYDLAADGSARDSNPWKYMVAGSIDHKWCDTDLSIGAAYRKNDNLIDSPQEGDSAYIVGAYIQQHFGATTLTLAGTYTADPDTTADAANNFNFMQYNKYTQYTTQGNPALQREGWAIGAKLETDWCGYKLKAWGAYNKQKDYLAGAGVAKTFKGINFAVDYVYVHDELLNVNGQRVRAKAVYKF